MKRLAQLAEAAMEAAWLSTVLLVPLFLDKATSQAFEPAKAALLRALAVVAAVAWLTRALTGTTVAQDVTAGSWLARAKGTLRAPWLAAALAWLVAVSLSTLFSLSPRESLWGHFGRAQGMLTLLAQLVVAGAALFHLRTRAQLSRLVTCLILPSLPIAGYAVFQRFGLEPLNITFRETESQRVTSLLGQPVFLAAYLGMVMPFTAYRVVEASRALRRPFLAGAYAALLLLQASAFVLSESRGPALGLCAAFGVAVLAFAARRHARWGVGAVWGLGALVALVFALGLPARFADTGSGVEQTRSAKRAAETFDVHGGGGQFRVTTWQVATRVVANRAPLELADGSRDPHAGLRTLLGYGPDLQYAVTPPFYDAELTRLFGYFITDRFHNDLWDTLISGGVLGLASWLVLQSAVVFLLLQALGLTRSSARRRTFWLSYGIAACVGAGAAVALRGPAFVFLGLQGGAVLGLVLYLSGVALSRRADESATPEISTAAPAAAHEGFLIATLAALVGHLIEASFSFTVIATGTLFWIMCAASGACAEGRVAEVDTESPVPAGLRAQLPEGALLALCLAALGYAFVGGTTISSRPGTNFWNALTALGQTDAPAVPVVAILVATTLLFGALFLVHDVPTREASSLRQRVLRVGAIAAALGLACWLRLSVVVAGLARSVRDPEIVAHTLATRNQATSSFYLLGLALVLTFSSATLLRRRSPASAAPELAAWRGFVALACALLGLVWAGHVNLAPASADAAVAMGDQFRQQARWALADQAYQRAVALRPEDDGYHAMLAKAYVAHARADAAKAPSWLAQADQHFVTAIRLNPASGEHAVNLAMVRANQAQRASGDARASFSAELPELYKRALRLNPQDPAVWRAWAGAQLNLLADPAGALASAQHSLQLEPKSAGALALVGDSKFKLARRTEGDAARALHLEAAEAYEGARALAPNQPSYSLSAGRSYLDAGDAARALPLLRLSLANLPVGSRNARIAADLLHRAESQAAPTASVAAP